MIRTYELTIKLRLAVVDLNSVPEAVGAVGDYLNDKLKLSQDLGEWAKVDTWAMEVK